MNWACVLMCGVQACGPLTCVKELSVAHIHAVYCTSLAPLNFDVGGLAKCINAS